MSYFFVVVLAVASNNKTGDLSKRIQTPDSNMVLSLVWVVIVADQKFQYDGWGTCR